VLEIAFFGPCQNPDHFLIISKAVLPGTGA
jgi:hypothetical protein